ncbi:MAG: metallophosphoesterase [Eubacteriales bacterium]
MRIVVISDTHRCVNKLINNLKNEKLDLIIHLGDYIRDAEIIENELGFEIIKVKGNCDISELDEQDEIILNIKDKKILVTHGHKYNVKFTLDNLHYRVEEIEADIVLFGHTHKPFNQNINDVLFFNPGSPTNPRNTPDKTYGIIDIDDKIKSKIIKF